MAYTNMLREETFAQKKQESFAVAELAEGSASFEIPAASGNYKLFNLPANAIITDAYIFVDTVSNAATSNTATLGTTEGGTQILSAASLKTLGKVGTFTGMSNTTTGKPVFLGITVVGATTAAAKFKVVVKYLEYRKTTGEYTVTTE